MGREVGRDSPLRRCAVVAAPLVLLLAAPALRAAPADEIAYGAYLAAECVTCHAKDASRGGIPSLRAMPPDRLAAALAAYRDGSRPNATMQTVARSLGAAEIAALAAYLATRDCAPERVDGPAC